MRFALAVAGLLICSASASFAKDTTYSCHFNVPQTEQWVPEQVVILHTEGTKNAVVNDPLISHFNKKPVTGQVKTENAKRITFGWELPFIRNAANQVTTRFVYRATYYKATGEASISGKPLGYTNNFSAFGTCTIK